MCWIRGALSQKVEQLEREDGHSSSDDVIMTEALLPLAHMPYGVHREKFIHLKVKTQITTICRAQKN
jgi:hypothetical protein